MAIQRSQYIEQINSDFRMHPVVALLGPRQCGKTTLARSFVDHYLQAKPLSSVQIFDLENPIHVEQLKNPLLALQNLTGLIVIDEIQLVPELFKILRVLVDDPKISQQYLILGSASRDLIRQSSETLAGRIAYREMQPFNLYEAANLQQLWSRGGFPLAYLAPRDADSISWRNNYIKTFLERDIPNLGFNISANTLRRFWIMLAHCHANILNSADLGRSLGIANTTIKKYLDILVGTFMVRELKPWHENIKKRQVKQSKVYIRDSGIYHALLGILSYTGLQETPVLGASWEGFALEQIIQSQHVDPEDCYFWATHQGAELDLLIVKNGKKRAFEFKYMDAPKMTKSMYSALESLELENLTVIYPGKENYQLHERVYVVGLVAQRKGVV
ncbi:MAG: hypothetical protein COB50_02645 [Thiotrichales bacterium]|nr:MAG: hypothetical protein COB50_02645 [Thiotrichales bacterium]